MDNKRTNNKYLYHYTSAKTLCYIFKAKQIGNSIDSSDSKLDWSHLVFLGTDISMLNDRYEYKELTRLSKKMKEYVFIDDIDKAIMGIPFVMSFSSLPNSLSMWRQYADNGMGVCLQFDKEALDEMIPQDQKPYEYIRLGKCNYKMTPSLKTLYEELGKLVKDDDIRLFDSMDKYISVYREYAFQSSFLKDNSFQTEKEWRIVAFDKHYKFYPSSFGFTARAEIEIPVSALKRIQAGPCVDDITKAAIKRWIDYVEIRTRIHIDFKCSRRAYRG